MNIIDTYLTELEIQEVERLYIEEALKDISLSKMKTASDKNLKRINKIAVDIGVDIKKVNQRDFKKIQSIIRKGFERNHDIKGTSKAIGKYIIEVTKRVWKPKTTGERISSSFLMFVLGIVFLLVIHHSAKRLLLSLMIKFKSGPKVVIPLILKTILTGPVTEEFFKRFMIKKYGNKSGIISGAAFGFVEWALRLKGLMKGSKLAMMKDLAVRLVFHTYTSVVQVGGIELDKMTKNDQRTFEYSGFVVMVAFHSVINFGYIVEHGLGGTEQLKALWKGDLKVTG